MCVCVSHSALADQNVGSKYTLLIHLHSVRALYIKRGVIWGIILISAMILYFSWRDWRVTLRETERKEEKEKDRVSKRGRKIERQKGK